jgi:Winged helix DNA-binding domain
MRVSSWQRSTWSESLRVWDRVNIWPVDSWAIAYYPAASMTSLDIAHQRLLSQHVARSAFKRPDEAVGWLGAVQAQDYAGAKWALGLRLRGATDDTVDQAFANGSILRTHVMRPTWHFVTPADIRWMLALTAPRVHVVNACMYRKLELVTPRWQKH